MAFVLAFASAVLAIDIQQSDNGQGFRLNCVLNQLYDSVIEGFEPWLAPSIVTQIRQSEPGVYVDGRVMGPLEYGQGARMDVQVPGDGVYSIITYSGELAGVKAGHIHKQI